MLRPGWHGVLVVFGDTSRHQDVKGLGHIIPLQFYDAVPVTIPILGEFMSFLQATY